VAHDSGLRQLAGRPIAVGLRPEAWRREADGHVLASVVSTEQLGADRLVHATIDCPGIRTVGAEWVNPSEFRASICVQLSVDDDVSLWEPLRLGLDVREVHVFDLETGRRIDIDDDGPVDDQEAETRPIAHIVESAGRPY
jgi:multiple sugar transport system ATP-binding protein